MCTESEENLSAEARLERRMSRRAALPGGTERILVVDDEPLVQRVNAHELRKLGYEVACANSGDAALAYLKEHEADLLLLDLMMPGKDGVDTFREVLELKPDQKAVVYSGFAQPARVEAIRQMGIHSILVKPTPVEVLASAIRDALDANDGPT